MKLRGHHALHASKRSVDVGVRQSAKRPGGRKWMLCEPCRIRCLPLDGLTAALAADAPLRWLRRGP
jgi:hypothetical protein